MSSFEMKIFNLQTAETGVAQFPDADAAIAWMRERPKFLVVQGPVGELAADVEAKLRAAMRPLDDEELAARDVLDIERELERRDQLESENAKAWGGAAPTPGAALVQVVAWTRGGEYKDAERPGAPVSAPVREAARQWLLERDRWVHAHNHYVHAATLRVTRQGEVTPDSQFGTKPGSSDDKIE